MTAAEALSAVREDLKAAEERLAAMRAVKDYVAPKRGRPILPPGQAKTMALLLKMSPGEKQLFTDAAQIAGLTLSAWIRSRLIAAALKEVSA